MNETTIKSVGLKYGVLLGAALIGFFLLIYILDLAGNQTIQYASYIFIIGAVVLALREYKEGNDGFMSFGKGLGGGMLTIAVGSVISSLFSYVFLKFLDPSYMQRIVDITRERMEENPNLTEEQVEQAMESTMPFLTPEAITVFGIVGTLVVGLIICLIISAIMKKDVPEGV